MKLKIGLVFLT
ncbi:hypothetical protein D029_2475A, partial [Vibrio parahaemolyticus 970107]